MGNALSGRASSSISVPAAMHQPHRLRGCASRVAIPFVALHMLARVTPYYRYITAVLSYTAAKLDPTIPDQNILSLPTFCPFLSNSLAFHSVFFSSRSPNLFFPSRSRMKVRPWKDNDVNQNRIFLFQLPTIGLNFPQILTSLPICPRVHAFLCFVRVLYIFRECSSQYGMCVRVLYLQYRGWFV